MDLTTEMGAMREQKAKREAYDSVVQKFLEEAGAEHISDLDETGIERFMEVIKNHRIGLVSESSESFIKQTAHDYDMPEDEVQRLYNKTGGGAEFYEELELYLKSRANESFEIRNVETTYKKIKDMPMKSLKGVMSRMDIPKDVKDGCRDAQECIAEIMGHLHGDTWEKELIDAGII